MMKSILAALVLALPFASLASAQLTRTWVSSTGLDANPCSRAAPCATFQGAHNKTNPGGEINCADAGDFGLVTINRSITIDCKGTFGSILVPLNSVGIIINATAADVITLRNLSLDGGRADANNGIEYRTAKAVHLQNLRISGFGTVGVSSGSAPALLTIDNATISDCNFSGVFVVVNTPSDTAVVSISNTRIANTQSGVVMLEGSRVTIRNSTIIFNNKGVEQAHFGGGVNTKGSVATVVNSALGYNNTALNSRSGYFMLGFGDTFVNNKTAFWPGYDQTGGGTTISGGDNNLSGDFPGDITGGTVPKI